MPCLSGLNAFLTPFRGWVRVHLDGQRVAHMGTLQKNLEIEPITSKILWIRAIGYSCSSKSVMLMGT